MNMQYKRYQRACEAYDEADVFTRACVLAEIGVLAGGFDAQASAATVASQVFPSITAFVEVCEKVFELPVLK